MSTPKHTASELTLALAMVVKTRRAELQISQEEFAQRAGLHRTYISDLERGNRNVSLKTLDRVATALEIDLAQLVRYIESKRRQV